MWYLPQLLTKTLLISLEIIHKPFRFQIRDFVFLLTWMINSDAFRNRQTAGFDGCIHSPKKLSIKKDNLSIHLNV